MLSPLYSEEILQSLPSDRLEANDQMLVVLEGALSTNHSGESISALVNAVMVYLAFRESRGMPKYPTIEWTHAPTENYNLALNLIQSARIAHQKDATQTSARTAFEQSIQFFAMRSGAMFCYQFNEDDIATIQKSLNDLRDLVSAAKELEEDHRVRLFKRLEQLQSELHKKLSDLDRFWGLVGDAGVVLKKFGEDTKAVRRIIYAITAIIVKVQAVAHGLPAPPMHPLLPSSKEFADGDLEV